MKNTLHIIQSLLRAPSSPRFKSRLFLLAAAILLLIAMGSTTFAGNATWKKTPATGDWNTAGNWTAGGPPNGTSDTATFAFSNTTSLSVSANTEVNGIVFNAGASAFTITASPIFFLTVSGVGIANNSGITQNFVTAVDSAGSSGAIAFTNSATAGNLTAFTNNAAVVNGTFAGQIFFSDTSTADNGSFTNNGSAVSGAFAGTIEFSGSSTASHGTFVNKGSLVAGGSGGQTFFTGSSTAGSSLFTNNGGVDFSQTSGFIAFSATSTAGNAVFTNNGGTVGGASGGNVQFTDTSAAGNGTFINKGSAVSGASGGQTVFFSTSSASNATLIAKSGRHGGGGGTVLFFEDSTGGTARVEVFGNGILDISGHNAPGVSVGSIEGSGVVTVGFNNLGVGTNSLNTTFSGVIEEGLGGAVGSLTKVGTGTLTLSGANTYTGGTTLKKGKLLVTNTSGSGTGTGKVKNSVGTLGGTGTISGAVTVGKGSGAGAFLSPGMNGPGILTIEKALTFKPDATYTFELNSSSATADNVVAKGVTISAGAQFSFADLGSGTLTLGTVFTVINNTAATPIAGTFSNLADGATFNSNGNNFQASYTGGTGNDLTLTVVP